MVKLTEDMVVARSKSSELCDIKKLNCWGSELTNVSVVRKMRNVEILSLSVNQISTLEDFQYCDNLQELYIRKNLIKDINEVLYLRNIPKLKSLWLADNPCADFELYRMTVLRTLPHLEKLDNVPVESEEIQQALVTGLVLPLPNSNLRGMDRALIEKMDISGDSVTRHEIPRSSSMGDAPRNDSRCSSGGSLSESSLLQIHQQQSTQVNIGQPRGGVYNQSLEETYDCHQNIYDEDDEQPPIRRLSHGSQHSSEVYERRPTNQSSMQPQDPRSIRYYESAGQVPVETKKGCPYPYSQPGPRHHSVCASAQQRQSVPQAQEAEISPSLERPYSHTSADCTPEISNGSQIPREDGYATHPRYINNPLKAPTTAVQQIIENNNNSIIKNSSFHRRSSREQYREQLSGETERGARPVERVHNEYRRLSGEVRHFGPPSSSMGEILQQQYDDTYRRVNQQIETAARVSTPCEKYSPSRPYPMRPKTRNANVLSAMLCLIKELDYSSLEVVEMAVRCRMEELDD